MFNDDDDDDMDIAEIDKVLLAEKTPLPPHNAEGKGDKRKSQNNSVKTKAEVTSQRYIHVSWCLV